MIINLFFFFNYCLLKINLHTIFFRFLLLLLIFRSFFTSQGNVSKNITSSFIKTKSKTLLFDRSPVKDITKGKLRPERLIKDFSFWKATIHFSTWFVLNETYWPLHLKVIFCGNFPFNEVQFKMLPLDCDVGSKQNGLLCREIGKSF